MLLLITSNLFSKEQPCTVTAALQPPAHHEIEHVLKKQGGTPSLTVIKEIKELIHDILKGSIKGLSKKTLKKSVSKLPLKKAVAVLNSKPVTSLCKKMFSTLSGYLPALTYSVMLKGFVSACQSTHKDLQAQKKLVLSQDEELATSAIKRTAHHFTKEAVITLVYILYAPKAHPCDRMYALYILNTLNLMGQAGLAFERYRARTNRFYFAHDGTLLRYDPSKINHQTPKRLKALAKFFHRMADSQSEHREYLFRAMDYGVKGLEAYSNADKSSWHTKSLHNGWRYAAGILKEVTSIDVYDIRTIPPQKIFSHKSNRYLLEIMLYCSHQQPQERDPEYVPQDQLEQAYEVLTTYKNKHAQAGCTQLKIMSRYLEEVQARF